ncbi:MAG TPA: carboxymuconolactone decarboxylase family protein [Actinocrinis sp.]|nr:carboxymuconolactone decarboxylase family protein [Actinocrinis sp.]
MPHIALNDEDLPGITGLMHYRPETAAPLNALAEVLLRGENSLTPGERELIAARVSTVNRCEFCSSSHAAFAAAQLDGGVELVELARFDPAAAPLPEKLKALLEIASATAAGGLAVTTELVGKARAEGATDQEIHDTVLIAAAFCMFNRYVDGLATRPAREQHYYHEHAEGIVKHGYIGTAPQVPAQAEAAAV